MFIESFGENHYVIHVYYDFSFINKSQNIWFIIVWKVAGELQSLKNITSGSNSPLLVQNTAFHSSPSFILILLYSHQISSLV